MMANRMKNVNGIEVELTDAEEAERDAEEKAWADGALDRELSWLRQIRNDMLVETDWTQNRDVTLSNDADWKTYRQALRDITKGLDSVEKVQEKMKFDTKTKTHVNFPKKPS
tara:strand:- start:11 stop:346 length:336 start_codon:yes stop_codon:yes gene_type:complete